MISIRRRSIFEKQKAVWEPRLELTDKSKKFTAETAGENYRELDGTSTEEKSLPKKYSPRKAIS